jgi:hypothetical protein
VQQLMQERDTLAQHVQQLEQEHNRFIEELVALFRQVSPAVRTVQPDNRQGLAPTALVERRALDVMAPLKALTVFAMIPDTLDPIYLTVILKLYRQRLLGLDPSFWDLRIALNVLSEVLHPQTYLEVGTRTGWSLAQVLFHTPAARVFSFDLWLEDYSSTENPGPEYVTAQMRHVVPSDMPLDLTFVSGNSHDTIPEFFDPDQYPRSFASEQPVPELFDLITVDGDHSIEGAWMDLTALFPHVAIGGAIVFDDLELSLDHPEIQLHTQTRYPEYYSPLPEGMHSLGAVWDVMKGKYPNFAFIESGRQAIAVGIAIRLS